MVLAIHLFMIIGHLLQVAAPVHPLLLTQVRLQDGYRLIVTQAVKMEVSLIPLVTIILRSAVFTFATAIRLTSL